MAEAQKRKAEGLGIPKAIIDENPYAEAPKQKITLPSVPSPSKQQVEDAAITRLRNELEDRHANRGRVLPPALVAKLEKDAVRIYEQSREAAMKRVKAAEAEKGFELTAGQRSKIWKEEYSFAVLREMDEYYRPEAERRLDALSKTLKKEDREAMQKMREDLVSQMARRLALNPRETLSMRDTANSVWASGKMERTLEEMYGRRNFSEGAQRRLSGKAIEIYEDSRENAKQEIARIEKQGGSLSPGQKIIIWELEYRKMLQEEVKALGQG